MAGDIEQQADSHNDADDAQSFAEVFGVTLVLEGVFDEVEQNVFGAFSLDFLDGGTFFAVDADSGIFGLIAVGGFFIFLAVFSGIFCGRFAHIRSLLDRGTVFVIINSMITNLVIINSGDY